MLQCLATNHTTTPGYVCAVQPTINGLWSGAAGADCNAAICAWTCDEANFGTGNPDGNVYDRCKTLALGGLSQCL